MPLIAKQIALAQMEQFPIWASWQEPADGEGVLSWGEEGAELFRELEAVGFSDNYYFPILKYDTYEDWRIGRFQHFKAQIIAADGSEFSGYVGDEFAYFAGVFFNDEAFNFNVGLLDWGEKTLAKLRIATGKPLSPFFPLRYRTDFRLEYGERLEGLFGSREAVANYLQQHYGSQLQERDIVRVIAMDGPQRECDGLESLRRPPQVGDLGRIRRIYDPSLRTRIFGVRCDINNDPRFDMSDVIWFAEFAQHELEFVRRPLPGQL